MPDAAPTGARDPLARFRSLLDLTTVATFALVIVGGVVRVSDSGLGCGPAGSGTHGWPLCEGNVLPFFSGIQGETLIEFSHRLLAGIVAVMIAALAWMALRRLSARRALVWGSLGAVVLVLAQAGLGGLTVEHNLEDELVAAHLGLAMLLLGVLLWLRAWADPMGSGLAIAHRDGGRSTGQTEECAIARPDPSSRWLRRLAWTATALVLATIVAGGYVAGTEQMGAEGGAGVQGAHLACGDTFPACAGSFMPFGTSRLIDIQLTHRAFMYLAAAALVALLAAAWRAGVRSRPLAAVAVLLPAQILLGAVNVWAGIHAGLIVGHLALGTLLWMATVSVALSTR